MELSIIKYRVNVNKVSELPIYINIVFNLYLFYLYKSASARKLLRNLILSVSNKDQ